MEEKGLVKQPLAFGQMSSGMTGNPVVDIFLNPERFEQLQRGATLLANSKIVPTHFQGNVGGCFIAMNIALQLGVEPFMFMQKTYVIAGKLGIEAQVAIAVANQRRIFKEPLKYTFSGDYGKPITRKCVCTGILSANGAIVEMPLTWGEVEAEGWSKKGGSKWLTIPDQMFRYRTALWLIRTYAPEVLLGLNTVDELDDANVINITPEKPQMAAYALMGGADIGAPEVTNPVPPVPEPPAPPKETKTTKPKRERPAAETKPVEPAIKPDEKPADVPPVEKEPEPDKEPVEEVGKSPAPAEKPKTELEIKVGETMNEFAGVSYVFADPFTIENAEAVLKALQGKAGINDATFPLMTRTVTDGVMDRGQWTSEHWNLVRNMLLTVIKRGVEQKIKMEIAKDKK